MLAGAITQGTGKSMAGLGERRYAIPNAVLAMLIFVATETMLFGALVSAHSIVQSTSLQAWPPAGQPRLPLGVTAFNTSLLLVSGLAMLVAQRKRSRAEKRAFSWLSICFGLGAAFVALQGVEWAALLSHGLSVSSSNYGGFFYVIVGAHALHVLAALGALAWGLIHERRGDLTSDRLAALATFWYFVVLLWPVLFWRVYL